MQIKVASVPKKQLKKDTNVLEITVPERLREKHKSGLTFFDEAIGGWTPSTAMMILGGSGAGKTTLALQLADALVGSGHEVLFNTGEQSLYQIKMSAERLRFKNGFNVAQHTYLPDLLEHADHLRKAAKGKQFFLFQDSLQTLNDGKYRDGAITTGTYTRSCQQLVSWCQKTFAISAFICQVTKGNEFVGKNTLMHAVDLRVDLFIDLNDRSPTYGDRILGVSKNRYGSAGKKYVLDMNETGLKEIGVIE